MSDDSQAAAINTPTRTSDHAGNVILHLSDLHFGYKDDVQSAAIRTKALSQLTTVVKNLDQDWKPTIVCVTGDIAMQATSTDYSLAKAWVSELLDELGLTSESLVVCPGNHDVQRNVSSGYLGPKNNVEADRLLGVEHFEKHRVMFDEFEKFCSLLSIPMYSVKEINESYLTGVRDVRGIRFVCLNSAWFSQRQIVSGEYDDTNMLWLGLGLLEYLEAKEVFPNIESDNSQPLTIVIFHHPFDALHDNERNERPPRKSPKKFIACRSHLVLTGHDHGVPDDPDPLHGRAYHFRGGATYEHSKYQNSFHLIKLEKNYLKDRGFIYRPSSSTRPWNEIYSSGNLYYWDYSKNIIDESEKQKEIARINENYSSFEEAILQGDYEKGVEILRDGEGLIRGSASLIAQEEKNNIVSKYGEIIRGNISLMPHNYQDQYKKVIMRVLSI